MNIDNLKSQMRKGMLEFCVLLLLRHGDAYASEIITKMKEAHLIVMEGTLYPLLTRLKNDGLLAYRWEESPSGPPRKYYGITPLGLLSVCIIRLKTIIYRCHNGFLMLNWTTSISITISKHFGDLIRLSEVLSQT